MPDDPAVPRQTVKPGHVGPGQVGSDPVISSQKNWGGGARQGDPLRAAAISEDAPQLIAELPPASPPTDPAISAANLAGGGDRSSGWPVWARRLVSLVLVYHLAGLLVGPATVEPCPRVFQQIYPLFGGWLQLLNMNQGNHFFAPDPGASTLVQYRISTKAGGVIEGRIPDRATWPRLLYHRHFMLTESLGNTPETELRERRLICRAMARELLRQHDGLAVELTQLTHEIITLEESRAGVPLEVPDSYVPRPLGRYEASDFLPEERP